MFKKILFLQLLISMTCYAQSSIVTLVQGGFRTTNALNKVVFVNSLNRNFTDQEYLYLDTWLTKRLQNSGFVYNNLSVYFNVSNDLGRNIKGCFNSWFKTLLPADRITLTEHFKPNGMYTLNAEEIERLSNSILKYTNDNLLTCKNDNFLGDVTTAFITIGLEQYLSDRMNNLTPDLKYHSVLSKVYDQQFKKIGWEHVGKLTSWLDETQPNYPLLSVEALEKYLTLIQQQNNKKISETEAAFILLEALNVNPDLLKEVLLDHNKLLPYIQTATLLYSKCFSNGEFIADKCDVKNIGSNLVIVKLNRKTKSFSHILWVGS
ncbi:hypothetical protein QEJ31_03305 [Pigmentibacter sp. JX0631]|uniref:hypothetical protein n=1 Tax=Pigmentibacter sp. JX0631 TaxID=2976982 RepID=UPI0024697C84|nr:hypothetical protein [Pigmentibacter sp. JX0631]WGL60629.1 hypothetical protein QEJ31_03305 [Pigmentibacter sp. JX0631]